MKPALLCLYVAISIGFFLQAINREADWNVAILGGIFWPYTVGMVIGDEALNMRIRNVNARNSR